MRCLRTQLQGTPYSVSLDYLDISLIPRQYHFVLLRMLQIPEETCAQFRLPQHPPPPFFLTRWLMYVAMFPWDILKTHRNTGRHNSYCRGQANRCTFCGRQSLRACLFMKTVIPQGKTMTHELIHDSYYGQVVAKYLFMGQFLS